MGESRSKAISESMLAQLVATVSSKYPEDSDNKAWDECAAHMSSILSPFESGEKETSKAAKGQCSTILAIMNNSPHNIVEALGLAEKAPRHSILEKFCKSAFGRRAVGAAAELKKTKLERAAKEVPPPGDLGWGGKTTSNEMLFRHQATCFARRAFCISRNNQKRMRNLENATPSLHTGDVAA